jgi:hypothetical protein
MSAEATTIQPSFAVRWRSIMRPGILLALLALVQGVVYMLLLPPWQHYDEPTHFEYAWLLANRTSNPTNDDIDLQMRREVAQSMLQHGFYRGLPQPELEQEDATRIWIGLSQLGKSPVYYALVSVPLLLMRGADITAQLYAARAVSLALFVATILIIYGTMRDLAPPRHPLRWLVPLVVALVPPFADIMTSVNSDAGAVAAFSLFLWGVVRTIRYGLSARRVAWVLASAVVCALVKETSLIAVALAPLGLFMAFWTQRGWRWRYLLAACALAALTLLVATFGWGDAQAWYRWGGFEQPASTRTARADAVLGTHVVTIQTAPGSRHQLLNGIAEADVARWRGKAITVGGWLWAEQPGTSIEFGVVWSEQGAVRFANLLTPVELTDVPTFHTHTVTVPPNAGKVYFALQARPPKDGVRPSLVYLDGAVVADGERSMDAPPTYADDDARSGTWDGQAFRNVIRNASGEGAWPRLRPWVAETVPRVVNRERLWIVTALFDWSLSVPFAFRTATQWVLYGLFGRFAWGHIALPAVIPPVLFQAWAILAITGSVWWLVRSKPAPRLRPALAFLALSGLVVWISVALWPLSYVLLARAPLPSSRYTFPVILPTLLVLVGGWWALWPRRVRPVGVAILLGVMVLFNVLAIITIRSFYGAA